MVEFLEENCLLRQIFYAGTLIIIFIITFEFYYRKIKRDTRVLFKIPASPAIPVFGHALEGFFMNREQYFLEDRKKGLDYYPIYRINLVHIPNVMLVSPEDIELLLSSSKHITKGLGYEFLGNWLGTGLLTSTGSKWQTRRKILTPAFHFNILKDFINIFNEGTKHLVKKLHETCHEGDIDVVKPITEYTLTAINETAMGSTLEYSQELVEKYKQAVYRIGELVIYRALRPWLYMDTIYGLTKTGKEEKEVISFLHDLAYKVIKERESNFDEYDIEEKLDDLSYSARKRLAMLDLLLSAKKKDKIDIEGIREEVDTFMFEGHDTTSMGICFSLMMIANHKDVQEKLYEEITNILGDDLENTPSYNDLQSMKYLEICIKEILRLYPSVPGIGRLSSEEFITKTGYVIPKDVLVTVCIYDVHHNPNVWPDPEKFDPDRFLPENCKGRHPYAYIPFSAGPRNCIGQKFAMLELKATLCGILREFILEPGHKREDIVMVSDLVLRPNEKGVRVKFIPRRHQK